MSEFQGHSAQPVGRPRDDSIDERVYAACRELLLEVGWDSLSLRQVATRAGVSRTSAHLRWSSKAELVLHAILGQLPDLEPFAGTDRAGWIAWVVEGSHRLFARPEVRAALPGLLVALREDPELRTGLWRGFSDPAVGLFAAAQAPGVAEVPQAILIMAAGAALFSTVVASEDDTPQLRSTITELLCAAAANLSTDAPPGAAD